MIRSCLLLVPSERKSANQEGELMQAGVFPPLGLAYIATALEKAHPDIDINIIDALAENLSEDELLVQVEKINPDIIGITVLTQQVEMALSVTRKIKAKNNQCTIVWGGPHVHFEHEKAIQNNAVDFCVRGEGEITFAKLIAAINDKTNLRQVEGITFLDEEGQTIVTPDRPFIQDLDTIGFPARELLNIDRYSAPIALKGRKPFASILATRGCPFDCHFCSLTKMWQRRQRRRSVENVLDEIGMLYKTYGIKSISFVDDLLVLDRKWTLQLCAGLVKRGLHKKIIWECCGRIRLMTEELLLAMKKAGCRCVDYGIEFGNQRILDFVNKGFKIADVHKTVALTNKVGIPVKGLFMMGYPTETKETMQDTIDLAKNLKMDYFTVSVAAPYPGTDLYAYCVKHDLLEKSEWVDLVQLRYAAIKHENFTLDDVIQYTMRLMKACMLKPSYIMRTLFNHPAEALRFGPPLLKRLFQNFMVFRSKH
jgi:anaerobic magnesium-protoporphyrin IX monomethyl ester cyclase